jgi:chromosome partitioning protein
MTKVIALVNQKGGVAKTTSTVHLGAAIAETGKKVLLVDLDSHGHIAEAFNVVADEIEYDLLNVMLF